MQKKQRSMLAARRKAFDSVLTMRAYEPTCWFKFQNALAATNRLRAICAPLVCDASPQNIIVFVAINGFGKVGF
jgi:hypothetical protein